MLLKNTLKFIIIVLTLLLSYGANAQSFSHGIGVGAYASGGKYTLFDGTKLETSFRPGGKIYWMGRVLLEGNLSFAPEVGYALKGFRIKNPDPAIKEQEIIFHYLEFKFLQEYAIKEKFYAKLGPSISAAVAGRDKQLSSSNIRSNNKLAFNFAAWGRFEAALNIQLGVHLSNKWVVEIVSTRGFSNLWDGDDGPNVKNNVIGLSIGKYF
jgi:hypothetical protein